MIMPPRLTTVGELERPDHVYLPEKARCYFWGEYTPYKHTDGKKWDYSPTNKLISNFKKKMDRANQPDWHYKIEAIQQIAGSFSRFWKWNKLHQANRVTLIPVPPSKARTDPMFDPRMLQMLTMLAEDVRLDLDIRDCLSFSGAYEASHESEDRPKPVELYAELKFDNDAGKSAQPPGVIFLFDDMLTTGAHYVAATQKLEEIFPSVPVIGNFIARRCIPDPYDDFDVVTDT